MARAATGITRAILARYKPSRVLVLCGPGNNGGDGLLVAHRLRRLGWPVTVASAPAWRNRKGDAAWAGSIWAAEETSLEEAAGQSWPLVVDAVFGAGFKRNLEPGLVSLFAGLKRAGSQVVAVDVPSGVDGSSGLADAATLPADQTVTFVRLKRGHVLLPARPLCGDIIVVDIGITDTEALGTLPRLNSLSHWRPAVPNRQPEGNKYTCGHALIVGGPGNRCGASVLAAKACQAAGAGLVTLACREADFPIFATHLREVMLTSSERLDDDASLLADRRTTAVVIGPALGFDDRAIGLVRAVLAARKPVVLDADAISLLGNELTRLRDALHQNVIMTPHDGEFARVSQATGSRLDRALQAAAELGVVVLLKGGDTVIAAPDGRALVNANAPPTLAVAGSGDVLAGIAGAMLARGTPPFEAAAASAWRDWPSCQCDGTGGRTGATFEPRPGGHRTPASGCRLSPKHIATNASTRRKFTLRLIRWQNT